MTIEKKTARTILQKPTIESIGGEDYEIKAQSLETLICVSELIAELPNIENKTTQILAETLAVAKDCSVVTDIIAMLVLGCDNLISRKKVRKKILFGLITYNTIAEEDNFLKLKKRIKKLTPAEVYSLTIKVLKKQEIADFFALTTSLAEINILQKTKRETPVSGR